MSKKPFKKNNNFNLFKINIKIIISIITLSIGFGVFIGDSLGIKSWQSHNIQTDKINICFTPPSGCANLIANEIHNAHKTIHVQAFDFTSEIIANAIIKAKKRGVKIHMLLDRVNKNNPHSKMLDFEKASINVLIDKVAGIAHNKIIIIDKTKVITGSFNFTKGADIRNTENVLLINDEKIAEIYLKNWHSRYDKIR
jgi:phospholipase D